MSINWKERFKQHKEKLLHPEDSQAMEQAAQRGCAGSVIAGFQDPAGHNPERPHLTSDLRLL